MGILLGLLTASCWGTSDFVARFAAHKIGALRTSLYMQLAGFILLSLCLPWLGGWGHLADGSGWQPWAWGVLAGVLNCVATLSLYRSFEIGKLAVVAPISASYPVLTVLLSVLSGEHLQLARALGIACTLLGVALVAGGEKTTETLSPGSTGGVAGPTPSEPRVSLLAEAGIEKARRGGKGIGMALCSAIGFGFLFWLLGIRIVPVTGATQTVWMIRLTSSILTALVILSIKQPISLPRSGSIPVWLAVMGALDTGAFMLNNFGMQIEQVAVVSVLASLYGAVTVCLAAIFLRENVSRWQWLGIVSIFLGIFLISR
jgi:drug/metabolite transporter (DMT)-like permease